jgi:hypothetical protein
MKLSAASFIGLLVVASPLLCANYVTGFHLQYTSRRRLAFIAIRPKWNELGSYGGANTPLSNRTPTTSMAISAVQTSSTAAYLESLNRQHTDQQQPPPFDTTSQSTPETIEKSNSVQSSSSSSLVPMDTPARQSLPPYLTLHPFPNKGLGVITTIPISKGEFIGEYKGEVFTEEVKDRRYLSSKIKTVEDEEWIQSRMERDQSLTGCYVYGITIPPTKSNNFATNQRIYIDAEDEYKSLWTRFLNHASPPNNNCNPKSIHESYDGKPRVWFVASRDVEVGEELCFDYGDDYWLEGDDVV